MKVKGDGIMETNAGLSFSISRDESRARLRASDEATLALCALTNDPDVWQVFIERFEPLIRRELGRTLAAGRKFLANDAEDDALGWFWIALLKDDREWLRRYDWAGGSTFASWLRALAWDVGTKFLRVERKRHLRERGERRIPRKNHDADSPGNDQPDGGLDDRPGCGAQFIANMRAIEPDPEKPAPEWR